MPAVVDAQRQPLLAKKKAAAAKAPADAPKPNGSATPSKATKDFPITVHPPKPNAASPLARPSSGSSSSTLEEDDDESIWIKDEHDIDRYFEGPMDQADSYSRYPHFMRLRGSILPKLVVPLTLISLWTLGVMYMIKRKPEFAVSSLLMNVLGFVVALSLSFRSSTAYERYTDGRKVWTRILGEGRKMARCIWLYSKERKESGREDLLSKVTAVNLILAFAVALKHKLRFEPHTQYEDLKDMISHLQTFAHEAFDEDVICHPKKNKCKIFGEYLGLSFAQSNPREALKLSKKPIGNLPLEILNYMSIWTQVNIENGNLAMPGASGDLISCINNLTETIGEAERILNTPLPVAYNIAFSQITLIYVYTLPFQLYSSLGWLTLPGTVVAAYIILGLASIGNSLENPFGSDTNDLPLDTYCQDLAAELDMLTSRDRAGMTEFVTSGQNYCLAPISRSGYAEWVGRGEGEVRDALKARGLLRGRKTIREEMRWRTKKRVFGQALTR